MRSGQSDVEKLEKQIGQNNLKLAEIDCLIMRHETSLNTLIDKGVDPGWDAFLLVEEFYKKQKSLKGGIKWMIEKYYVLKRDNGVQTTLFDTER